MFSRFFPDIFSHTPKPAPASMRIAPCSVLDVEKRDAVLTTGLVIDARLDTQKLEHSLSILVERKFPRAGARLAIRNGVYEFHIPCTFDSHTPAIAFTAEHYEEPFRSHARPDMDILSLANSSASEPFFRQFPSLRMYLVSRTCPTSTEGFLASDTPMVHVHVSVFDDLTLIGVTSSHIMFDALGTGTLLHAWTRLLAGDDMDVIPGMEWDMAPFESFRGPTTLNCVRGYGYFTPEKYPSSIIEPLVVLVLSWMRDRMRVREVSQLIRVPKAFLEDKRREIMENLKLQGSSEWVTSFDVLMAWWFKASYSLRRGGDTTPVFIHISLNLRPKPIFPGASILTKPYINNAATTIFVPPITAHAFQRESLGDLALRIRRATTAYNVDHLKLEHELCWRNANRMVDLHRCPPGAVSELQTNWCDAQLSDLDFSGACAPGSEKRGGRVLFVLTDTVMAKDYMSLRGNGAILMENENAIWMHQVKSRKEWEKLRQSGRFNFT
ncbi:hypothetical protein DFH09DRAFT_974716 [Mycena vulgaris]|nr:hypothetical protein DFH09DRAFT_974716 [Mycena vulgaris]